MIIESGPSHDRSEQRPTSSDHIGYNLRDPSPQLATYSIAKDETIIFWLYPIYGSLVTFAAGYAVSLATGGNRKDIDGLTWATLKNRTGGLDD
ncbi:hypothetical protein N8787_03050 [Opitutaceae bacterium]|nr:hypothetical protein [Opitutaceae bacterium]